MCVHFQMFLPFSSRQNKERWNFIKNMFSIYIYHQELIRINNISSDYFMITHKSAFAFPFHFASMALDEIHLN